MQKVFLMTLALIFLSFSGVGRAEAAAESSNPNVLLILSDDQSWTDYSFMGHPQIKTPNIDKLVEGGVVFKRGYVPTALCRPSLMTLVTGQYAHVNGITGNDPASGSKEDKAKLIAKIDQFDTWPGLLAEKGYLCHQSGKWWEGNFKRGGFTHGMTRGFPEKRGRHGDVGLAIGRKGLKACTEFIDMAMAEKKPFFMWYAPFMPHEPHTPPKELLKKYQDLEGVSDSEAKYYAMCEWFDETIGELVGYLEKKEIRDNTMIIYICDNGWIQVKNGSGYAARSKRTPYEMGVRQPIIFNWPKVLKPQDRPELVSSINILPMVLAATGARQPKKELPGLNLLPLMTEQKPLERTCIFGENHAHDIADVDDPEVSLTYRWCIEGEWKALLAYDGKAGGKHGGKYNKDSPQLYNLIKDPHEKENLAKEHPEILKRLVEKIDGWYPVTQRKVIKE